MTRALSAGAGDESAFRADPCRNTLRLLAGAWLVGALLLGLWLLRGLWVPFPSTRVQIEEPFNHGVVSGAARVAVRGFQVTPRGFALRPGGEGTIEYRVHLARPLTRWSAITLQWYGGEPGVRSALDLLGPDGARPLLENRNLVGTRLPLPPSLEGQTEIAFRFTGRNASEQTHLLLDKLTIQAWEGPLPALPGAGAVAGVCLAVGLGCAGLTRRPGRGMLVALLLTLAVAARYENLLRVALAPLDLDAQGYRMYAEMLSLSGHYGFYSASFGEREPLFLAVVKLALWILGDSDLSLRLLTLLLSLGVVYLAYRLGRAFLGFPGGLGAGLLLAISVPAIIESGRGLRVELETFLLGGCAWLLFGARGSLSWSRGLLAALLSGALLLTRFPYAPAILLVFAASAWWHRASDWKVWCKLLVGLAVAAAMVAPHRIALTLRYGDAAYDTHRTLRWIANQEFQGRPGFPSSAEVIRDPYAGPRITVGEYYLRLHTPWEFAWRSARGLGRTILNLSLVGYTEEVQALLGLSLRWLDYLVAALGVIGLGVLAGRGDTRWIPSVLVLGLAHLAFVYDLDLPDYRFRMILQVMPFFTVGVIAGGCWILAHAVALFPGRSASWAARALSAPLLTGRDR